MFNRKPTKLLDVVVEGFSWNFQSRFQDRIVRKIIPKQLGLPPSRKGIRRSKKSLLLLEGDFHGSPFALMPSAHVIQTHAINGNELSGAKSNFRGVAKESKTRSYYHIRGYHPLKPNMLIDADKTPYQYAAIGLHHWAFWIIWIEIFFEMSGRLLAGLQDTKWSGL